MELVQECRTSGLTDKTWCELNHIQRSSLYYHIRRFRNMACEIPENPVSSCQEQHEVVAVDFSVPAEKHFAKKNTSSSKEQITCTPSTSMIFACMVGKSRGSPRFCILFIMLDGDFKRLFMLSIGLRSCCNENSSFKISNRLSSAFSAQRYCSMTS